MPDRDYGKLLEKYIGDNHEEIESYIAYKRSEEYKAAPAYHLEKVLCQFNSMSGYNEIFIPAMCQLTKSYRKSYKKLSKANEKFAGRYLRQG